MNIDNSELNSMVEGQKALHTQISTGEARKVKQNSSPPQRNELCSCSSWKARNDAVLPPGDPLLFDKTDSALSSRICFYLFKTFPPRP